METFFDRVFWGNTVKDYFIAFGVILLVMLALRMFRKIALIQLKKWSEKTETTLDDFLVHVVEKSLLPILNIGALYAGIKYLTLAPKVAKFIGAGIAVALTYFIIRLVTSTIQHSFEAYVAKQENGIEKKKQLRGIMLIIKAIVWLIGLVFLLDNMGYDVTAVVTGLGIGGIAIALAAQTILGDLFSYFVIFFDRPFEIGDFITVDDKRGTVEYIGVKTTRLRSITGEIIVISNTNLTNSRLHNFKQMARRRIVFTIGVTYQTPAAKLQQIPQIIKGVIESIEGITFDRSHFFQFADSSLNFETVYFVESQEYLVYMDAQQRINMQLFEIFEKEGIEFAYPTQTLFIEKLGNEK